MAPSRAMIRPLASIKASFRSCQQHRRLIGSLHGPRVKRERKDDPLEISFPPVKGYSKFLPPPKVKPTHKTIPVFPSPPSTMKACPNPIQVLTNKQLDVLDPTGARCRLFSKSNPEGARVGDILLVRLKNGDPFSGICMNIRRGKPNHGVKRAMMGRSSVDGEEIKEEGALAVDTAILLRNTLTRVGVEVWFKVFSPAVAGIEVVRKSLRKMRRARANYLRHPKHDIGNVDNIVLQYTRKNSKILFKGAGGGSSKPAKRI